ncbi:hypothetical protein F443_22249 [Phytophthora nicotianae P1569]|uniref:Uncharacterized protein n=1 Tax=Phytophthora nicotianae P1569 TaxID=1317065 RepID=V9DUS6_PHYNI|nr:hypothetical protein F443_22249 [Phytophthora nicotianae P1569]
MSLPELPMFSRSTLQTMEQPSAHSKYTLGNAVIQCGGASILATTSSYSLTASGSKCSKPEPRNTPAVANGSFRLSRFCAVRVPRLDTHNGSKADAAVITSNTTIAAYLNTRTVSIAAASASVAAIARLRVTAIKQDWQRLASGWMWRRSCNWVFQFQSLNIPAISTTSML